MHPPSVPYTAGTLYFSCQNPMDTEALYQSRLRRYVTAMRNGKPDMIPIRPFVAEFTGVYAGYTCQELAHDYHKAFAAARKCAADFDWDAVVSNMVYVWTGLTQAIGLKYYGIPGIDIPADMGFQYREPPQHAGLHAGRRVRPTDRRPDRLPAERLAAARVDGGARRRASRSPSRTQPVVPQGRHGDDGVFRRLRRAERPAARGIGHGFGHRRHLQGADGHPGRQAARLPGAGRGPV